MEYPQPATTSRSGLRPILIAAVLQGWALYGLHMSIKHSVWPATQPAWLVALYTVSLLLPLTLQLMVTHLRERLTQLMLSTMTVVLVFFGWQCGAAVVAAEQAFERFQDVPVFACTVALLWLLALPFLQARLVSGRWRPAYVQLFQIAWRNHLTLAEAALFTGIFWALLMLWQVLFAMLGIRFFADLFARPLFIYPVTAITFGIALFLIGSLERWTQVVLEQILSVLKWLAVVAGLLLLLFTVALLAKLPGLVFTGQRAISAAWLLWLVAVVVLFTNAAYRDGTVERPYPQWLAGALRLNMPLLLIVAGTATYALWIRTLYYGLTVARCWAWLVSIAACAYAVGYALAALRRGQWLASLAQVNTRVALGLIVLISLMLTPVLSPQRLAASSQYDRALTARNWSTGSEGAAALHYLRFEAGRYGRARLAQLSQSSNQSLAGHALTMQKQQAKLGELQSTEWLDAISVYPAGATLDPALQQQIRKDVEARLGIYRSGQELTAGLMVDLDGDGSNEFVLLVADSAHAYQRLPDGWRYAGRLLAVESQRKQDVIAALLAGEFTTETSVWRDMVIGTQRYRLLPP